MVYLVISVGSGKGTTNPPPGEYVYPQGAVVTVEAIPDEGYVFVEFYLKNTARGTYYTSENPCTVEMPTGVPETLRVECTAYFEEAPPAPPPDVVLESYRWEIEPEATFPYTPDDVRQAYRLYLTLKNSGGPGRFRVKLYLRGSPSYVWWDAPEPELIRQTLRSIDAGGTWTIRDFVVPEPKGNEYYEVAVITVETGVERWYKLESPAPPEEKKPPAALIVASILLVIGLAVALATSIRRR